VNFKIQIVDFPGNQTQNKQLSAVLPSSRDAHVAWFESSSFSLFTWRQGVFINGLK